MSLPAAVVRASRRVTGKGLAHGLSIKSAYNRMQKVDHRSLLSLDAQMWFILLGSKICGISAFHFIPFRCIPSRSILLSLPHSFILYYVKYEASATTSGRPSRDLPSVYMRRNPCGGCVTVNMLSKIFSIILLFSIPLIFSYPPPRYVCMLKALRLQEACRKQVVEIAREMASKPFGGEPLLDWHSFYRTKSPSLREVRDGPPVSHMKRVEKEWWGVGEGRETCAAGRGSVHAYLKLNL